MAREVNVWTSNWKKTGVNVSVPQYSFDLTINWTANDGTKRTRQETLKFPNMLTNVTAADLEAWMSELMLREAMKGLVQ